MNMKVENVYPADGTQAAAPIVEGNATNIETITGAPTTVVPTGRETQVDSEPIRNEAFLNKVLHEKKTAVEKLKQYESENKVLRENELKRNENYKLLSEEREKEVAEWKAKYTNQTDMLTRSSKTTALKKELTKLGCDAKYLDKAVKMVSLDNIQYDDATGVVTGQLEAAKAIQEELPPLFGTLNVGVNQSIPAGTPTTLTLEAWKQLPPDEKVKRKAELYQNLDIRMK
jgi:hypothetical protein